MAEYLFTVKDRQTGEILFRGSSQECADYIGCEKRYIRDLIRNKPEYKKNTKYSMYEVERYVFEKGKRGGSRKKDVVCEDCGLLMKNVHCRTIRCPECARKYNNRSKAQRMREIRGEAPKPKPTTPIRNPNAKYCEGCVYYEGGFTKMCSYIFIKGKSRPCPPGKDCTVKIERKRYREKKERSTDIS